ncbi:MAG TPA: stalk domain-containing protein [Chthonomonadales bacterium]|nr:stalk domain-containing protein [Chthonomonadales bacterium]
MRWTCTIVVAAFLLWPSTPESAADAARARRSEPLRMSIITPEPSTIADVLPIDVVYRGAAIDSIELYLNNNLVSKREVGTNQVRGVLSFRVDTALLTEGVHEVQVRAMSGGRMHSVAARVRLPGADLTAPVRIAYPANGIVVSGVVPVRVNLTSDLQSQNPFVTFFVNRDLRVLRNFPPYQYNWDTTREVNGVHVLETWAQSADMASPYRSRPVHVRVDNAGGATRQKAEIEDLRRPPARAGIEVALGSAARPAGPPPAATRTAPALAPGRAQEPASVGVPARTAPVAIPGVRGAVTEPSSAARPRMVGGAAVQPADRMLIARASTPLLPAPEEAFAAPPVPRTTTSNRVTVRRGDTLSAVSRRTGVSATEIARLNNLPSSANLRSGSSLIVPRSGSFEVAFDGRQLAFDVAPRIENGLPLAPFRPVFEHTGGTLYWYNDAKTMRAVSTTREIVVRVGKAEAKVNNQPVTMERSAFLDRGRTIVPMSFIGESLNVRVSFNPETGRVLLRTR